MGPRLALPPSASAGVRPKGAAEGPRLCREPRCPAVATRGRWCAAHAPREQLPIGYAEARRLALDLLKAPDFPGRERAIELLVLATIRCTRPRCPFGQVEGPEAACHLHQPQEGPRWGSRAWGDVVTREALGGRAAREAFGAVAEQEEALRLAERHWARLRAAEKEARRAAVVAARFARRAAEIQAAAGAG